MVFYNGNIKKKLLKELFYYMTRVEVKKSFEAFTLLF
jgi:hypothetical protein